MATETRTLTKNTANGMVGGICAGLADYFDVDPVLVRALFVAAAVLSGFSIVLYLVLWIALDDAQPTPVDLPAPPAPDQMAQIDPAIDIAPPAPASPETSQDPVERSDEPPGP